jgi:hypothetical protein
MISTEGYIYVLSNTAFIQNLYKVGLTKTTPEKRAEELSRSTAAPNIFLVQYSRKVQDVVSAEKRIHMLLKEFRYSQSKEYYLADLDNIRNCVDRIAEFEEKAKCLNDEVICVRNDFILNAKFTEKQNLNDMKLLRILFANSTCNSLLDQITHFSYDDFIIQGFLSSKRLSQYLRKNIVNASKLMKLFRERQANTFVIINGITIKVFDELRYTRGELGWTFSKDFRNYFISSTK